MIRKVQLRKWLFPILLLVAMLILPYTAVFGSDEDTVILLDNEADADGYSVRVQARKDGKTLEGFSLSLYKVGDVTLSPLKLSLYPEYEQAIQMSSEDLNKQILITKDDPKQEDKQKLAQTIANTLSGAVLAEHRVGEPVECTGADIEFKGLEKGLYLLVPDTTDGTIEADATLFTLPRSDESTDELVIVPKVEIVTREYSLRINKVLTNKGEPMNAPRDTDYYFGLYSERLQEGQTPDPSVVKPVATTTVKVSSGESEGYGYFRGLAKGTYYVYELVSENGAPILDYQGHTKTGSPAFDYILQVDGVTTNEVKADGTATEITITATNRYHEEASLEIRKVLVPAFEGSAELTFRVQIYRQVGDAAPVQYGDPIELTANGEAKKVPIDLTDDRATGARVIYSIEEISSTGDPHKYVVTYSDNIIVDADKVSIGETEAESTDALPLTVTNTLRTEIVVEKKLFQYDEDDGISLINAQGKDLVYTIGLFEGEVNENSKPVKTAEIKVEDGKSEGTVTFSDLDLNKTYYVYELSGDEETGWTPILNTLTDEKGHPTTDPAELVAVEGPGDFIYYYTRYLQKGQTPEDPNAVSVDSDESEYVIEVDNVFKPGSYFRHAVLYLKKTLNGMEPDAKKIFYVDIFRENLDVDGSKPEYVETVEVPADGKEHAYVLSNETLEHKVRYTVKERDGKDGKVLDYGVTFSYEDGNLYTVTQGKNGEGVTFDLAERDNEGNPIEIINTPAKLKLVKKAETLASEEDEKAGFKPLILKDEKYWVGLYEGSIAEENLIERQVLVFKNKSESDEVTFEKVEVGKTYYLAEIEEVTGADGKKHWQPVTEEHTFIDPDGNRYHYSPIFTMGENSGPTLKLENYQPTQKVEIEFINVYLPDHFFITGQLTIEKNLFGADGNKKNGADNLKFYAGIYMDADFTTLAPTSGANMRVANNPVTLDLSKKTSAQVTFPVTMYESDRDANGVPRLTLYVTEVTKNGDNWVPVKNAPGWAFTVTYGSRREAGSGTKVDLSGDDSTTKYAIINNQETTVTPTPTPQITPPTITPIIVTITSPPGGTTTTNYTGNYSYTGHESYAVTQDTVGTTTTYAVVTGDDTPIALYVGILAAAGILIAALVIKRKKG